MTVKYEYKSSCCGHDYIEQRTADESIIFPMCNVCGQGEYELINETVISETPEYSPSIPPAEIKPTEIKFEQPTGPII